MKILIKGKIPEEVLYQAICPNCKSLIEFEGREAKYRDHYQQRPSLVIACPVCDKDIMHSIVVKR